MTCDTFERWLDAGIPEDGEALAHATACPCCAGALSSARELEALLAAAPAPAPDGFTDRVMARIEESVAARAENAWFGDVSLPWWLRAAAEPAAALAMALAALLAWRSDALWSMGLGTAEVMGAWREGWGAALASAGATIPAAGGAIDWSSLTNALLLGLAAPIMVGSLALYRWSERWIVSLRARPH